MLSKSRMARSSCDGVSDVIEDVTDWVQSSVVSFGCTLPLFRLSSQDMAADSLPDGRGKVGGFLTG